MKRFFRISTNFVFAFGTTWLVVQSANYFIDGFSKDWIRLEGIVVLFIISLFYAILCELRFNDSTKEVTKTNGLELITSSDALLETMKEMVQNANNVLLSTGSRGSDTTYFSMVEDKVLQNTKMKYYRVLLGPPQNQIFKNHLISLVEIRNPLAKSGGGKTMNISIFTDGKLESEKFILANDTEAIIIMPSIYDLGGFDTALKITDQQYVDKYKEYVKKLYNAGEKIKNVNEIKNLQVIA